MPADDIMQRMSVLEKRIAKLEKVAVLFEEHRQAWINMNKGLKKLKREIDRDKRKELVREKRMKHLWSGLGSSGGRAG
jgi:hypothetical protein